MLNNQITTIIFDCFGVIVSETSIKFRDRYLANDSSLIEWYNQSFRALDLGFISKQELYPQIASRVGLTTEEVFDFLENGSFLNELVLDFIKELKPRFKIGMLSNISPDRLDDFFSPEDKRLFDELVLSFDIGVIKPDHRAYTIAASRLNALPSQCIFIDDQPRNVQAAQEVGMVAFVYNNLANLKKDITETV